MLIRHINAYRTKNERYFALGLATDRNRSKRRIIRLHIEIGDESIETPGWWEPVMNAWSDGPMTSFPAVGWKEPTYEDGLLVAILITRETTITSLEDMQHRDAVIHNIKKELEKLNADI